MISVGSVVASHSTSCVSESPKLSSKKTVRFPDCQMALERLQDPRHFDKIGVVKELLESNCKFNINDYIDLENRLGLLDIAFMQENKELAYFLTGLGANVNQCIQSSHPSWLQIEIQKLWSHLNTSEEEKINAAITKYEKQLSESTYSFVITSRQAQWDTGQASAPTISLLMTAYAQRLALLPQYEQCALIQTDQKIWKQNFSPFDRSFVIALGNGLMHAFDRQKNGELQFEYAHRVKLQSAYKNMIRIIAPNLREAYRAELKEWVKKYHVFDDFSCR